MGPSHRTWNLPTVSGLAALLVLAAGTAWAAGPLTAPTRAARDQGYGAATRLARRAAVRAADGRGVAADPRVPRSAFSAVGQRTGAPEGGESADVPQESAGDSPARAAVDA